MRWVLIIAAILGAGSVVIGAGLRHLGTDIPMEAAQTALRYHQLHCAVLAALGFYSLDKPPSVTLTVPAALFICGILIFSGSLYAMAFFSMPVLGYLTPVGGFCLIMAWISLVFISIKKY